jgi:selenophosphate synthase
VHAATDVTGFGLIGHAKEMAKQRAARWRRSGNVPVSASLIGYVVPKQPVLIEIV